MYRYKGGVAKTSPLVYGREALADIAITPEGLMLSRLPTGRVWNDRFWFYTAYVVFNLLGFGLGAGVPYLALCLGTLWAVGVGALLYRQRQKTEAKKRPSFAYTLRLWALFTAAFTPGCLIGALLRLSVE